MHCQRRVSPHSEAPCGSPLIAGFCPICQPEKLAQDTSISTQRRLALPEGDRETVDHAVA